MSERYTPNEEEIRGIIEEALGEELDMPTKAYSNAMDVEEMEKKRNKIVEGVKNGNTTRTKEVGFIGSDFMIGGDSEEFVNWTDESVMAVELAIHDLIVGTRRMIFFATELVQSGVSVSELIAGLSENNHLIEGVSPILSGEDDGVIEGEFTEIE